MKRLELREQDSDQTLQIDQIRQPFCALEHNLEAAVPMIRVKI